MSESTINTISLEFVETLSKFTYFTNKALPIMDYIKECETEDLGRGISNSLFSYTTDILNIVNSDKVPSNADVKFLEKITLFNKTLNLKDFKSENRKTKKVIVKHLSNLLAVSFKYAESDVMNKSFENLMKSVTVDSQLPANFNPMEMMNDGKLMDMFSQNNELTSIVNKMTTKLMDSKVDPMQLLGSIMSGNTQSGVLQSLFSDIENDIKNMDKDKLKDITKDLESIIKK